MVTDLKYVDERQAAEILGLKPNTLSIWRCTKRNPLPYVRLSSRAIRYRLSDIEKFMSERTVTANTGEDD